MENVSGRDEVGDFPIPYHKRQDKHKHEFGEDLMGVVDDFPNKYSGSPMQDNKLL